MEIVGFQSLRGFPDEVDPDELRALGEAMDRNGLTPTALGANADVARSRDVWMGTDDSVAYMRPQMELAARLGFPLVRTQMGLTPEVLERLAPIAAKEGVRLGMEIHAPEGPSTPAVLAVREIFDSINSEYLGFIPDFSANMRAIPGGMLERLRSRGISEAGLDALVRAWEAPGAPHQRYERFAAEADDLGEPDLPVSQACLALTMFGREDPQDWREVPAQVVHIHGKFHEIDDRLESPSIDYREILGVFAEAEEEITMSSEWEGHAFFDLGERDAFEMVAGYQRMCRRLMDGDKGTPSVCDDKEDQL